MRLNGFANLTQFPEFSVDSVRSADVLATMNALQLAVGAGALTMDEGVEDHVRNVLGLPEREEAAEVGDTDVATKQEPEGGEGDAPNSVPKNLQQDAQNSERTKRLERLADLATAAFEQSGAVHAQEKTPEVHVYVPEALAPSVTVNVPKQPAPHMVIQLPAQPAPNILMTTPEPRVTVNVAPAPVHVTFANKLRKEWHKILRGPDGEMTGSEVDVRYLDNEVE